jgi:hypothetical protein
MKEQTQKESNEPTELHRLHSAFEGVVFHIVAGRGIEGSVFSSLLLLISLRE